jgi:homocysteine S-methyltransferase
VKNYTRIILKKKKIYHSYQTPIASFIEMGFTDQEARGLIQKSVHIATEARDTFWKEYQSNKTDSEIDRMKPMISLSLGPFGAQLSDGSEYTGDYGNDITLEKLREFHEDKLNIFKPLLSHVDFIMFETIPSYLEAQAICSLLQEERLDIPCLISFSCKSGEEVSHGESFVDCVQLCSKVDCVVGVGVNCTRPKYIEKLVKDAREELNKVGQEKKYVVCYPNGSVDWDGWDGGKRDHYTEISLKEIENYARIWTKLAKSKIILGGCCKTTPDHIRCIRNAFESKGSDGT